MFTALSLSFILLTSVVPEKITQLKVSACKQNIECKYLAEMGYYEARGESDRGVKAVMKVVINRTNHPKFPSSVEDVIKKPKAFSYRHDGSMKKSKQNNAEKQWNRIYNLAFTVYYFRNLVNVHGATHYHTTKVNPKWADEFNQVAHIGNHVFYRCTKYC